MKYSIWIGLRKTLINALIFGAPLLVSALPEAWMNLTLSGLIKLGVNYAVVKWQAGTPNQ